MKCVALASGKGGVGKTLLTAALGLTLAEEGHPVLLFDGDMGLRNLDMPLGLNSGFRGMSRDVVGGYGSWGSAFVSVRPNLDVILASEKYGWRDISRNALLSELKNMSDRYDYMLLDCPAGLGKGIRFAKEAADIWFLLVGPSWASLRCALRTAKFVKSKHPIYFIFNDFTYKDTVPSLSEAVDSLKGYAILGALPHSREVHCLAQKGQLENWTENNAFRRAVRLLANAYLRNTIYPFSHWLEFHREAERENQIAGQPPNAGKERLLLRQKRMAEKWRRRW